MIIPLVLSSGDDGRRSDDDSNFTKEVNDCESGPLVKRLEDGFASRLTSLDPGYCDF